VTRPCSTAARDPPSPPSLDEHRLHHRGAGLGRQGHAGINGLPDLSLRTRYRYLLETVTVGAAEAKAARSKRRSAHGAPRGVVAHEPSQEDARPICVGAHGTVSETGSLEFPLELRELSEKLGVSPCLLWHVEAS
jgi:hypothetical protein